MRQNFVIVFHNMITKISLLYDTFMAHAFRYELQFTV